jgi:hypothetical protein
MGRVRWQVADPLPRIGVGRVGLHLVFRTRELCIEEAGDSGAMAGR